MKFPSGDNRSALSVRRLTLALVMVALVPLLLYGSAPSWWSQRGVLVEDELPDDYAPVNQGQLKNIAKAAVAEMDARLTGGAGDPLHTLISGWSPPRPQTNDYAPINLGQLKNVARLFYDRLIAAGLADHYPWVGSLGSPDDFTVANIGQVKHLFSFEVPVPNVLDNPLGDRLAAGHESANLALEAHTVWIWGDHLSNGNVVNYPRRIQGVAAVSSGSAGESHLVLLGSDGAVWTWGENTHGQLGDGTTDKHDSPAAVPNLLNVAAVKAGGRHTLALKNDGTVVAWGDNEYGQLGCGGTTDSPVPEWVSGLSDVRKIAAGYQRSMALKSDGTVWIWGYDHYAWQTAQDLFNTVPVIVPALTDVIDVAAGYEHNVAVKADGTVWAWGSNYANQIGDGSPTSKFQDAPVRVANLVNITKVASSYDHTLALAADGTVWAWGENFSSQLGDGTNQSRAVPVQVSGLTGIVAIATAYSYSLAMKADGTVWAWGNGAIGVLPGVDKRVPQLVNFGVSDANHNGMDDRWELQYLGGLGHSPDADLDGDGVSNLREFLRGSDPTDYFDGATPTIEIAGGNNQIGDPGAYLAKPFVVRVRNAQGKPQINAPVNFAIASGSGSLAPAAGAPKQQALLVRTDLKGEAAAYHALPQAAGTSTRTTVSAGKSGSLASVTFRSIAKFSVSPPPAPSPPPPGSSPTPTPSATPTPPPPYRYAIIDLGKDLSPSRIANNGAVLLSGRGSNQGGYFRWKSGVLEQLTYAGDYYNVEAADMNDDGVTVGVLYQEGPWINNAENEVEAGLKWNADSAAPVKISAPLSVANISRFEPGSARQAAFTAVNNKNEIFGRVRTGVVLGGISTGGSNDYIAVLNAYYWPVNLGTPTPLSFASARMESSSAEKSLWQGTSDTVLRASSSGHYIGRKFTPSPIMFQLLQGIVTGMIDGETVPFWPKDINETGIVVGDTADSKSMVIRTLAPAPSPPAVPPPSVPDTIFQGVSPIAINSHVRPVSSPLPQTTPAPTVSPTPIPVPQILAWANNALVVWERQEDGKTWHPFGLEEMIPNMEGWEFLRPEDMNDSGAIVGQGWYTDPSNPHAQRENRAFLLVPVELMVDANRDGEMSFVQLETHHSDITTEGEPFSFWINDDQDAVSGTTMADEITPPILRDNQDEKIQSIRDCEDLARLWLNLGGLTEAFKSGAIKLILKFRNVVEGNPSVRVFRSAESGGRGYVSNEGWGALQASPSFNQALPGVAGPGLASSSSGIHIDRQFWQGLDEFNPVINLLFEGTDEGKGEIYCEIRSEGRKIAETPGVQLHVKNLQSMYERVKANPEDLAAPYTRSAVFTGPVSYVADPNGHPFQKPWDETGQCVIFVHGWNVSYDEYTGVAGTMFKRLWHQGFKGHYASFRWDTRKSDGMFDAGEYNRSENRAYVYGAALKQWAMDLSNSYTVNLIGHSMGNVVCGEALRQGMQVRNYLLMEAAVPVSCYDSNASPLARLVNRDAQYPTPDYHVDPITNEKSLGYRGYLQNVTGTFTNFHNPDDWALASGFTIGLESNWEKNQIDYKPDGSGGGIHNPVWNYHCDLSNPLGWRAWMAFTKWRYVTDSWEMKAFVARSRTKAVGALASGNSIFTENVNLSSPPYNFGRERPDHSGQCTRDIQKVDALYHVMHKALAE